MEKKILKVFLFIVFLNALFWVSVVPIWHYPDEQAHFGQVAFIAEKGRNSIGDELDLTEEIYVSEQLLGTARDKFGNNRFTFHPENRIEYTDSLIGKYETQIAALANTGSKNKFVHKEASRYPMLYYIPASWFYKLFYAQDLFIRVFAIRFWSLLLFVGTVYVIYLMGKLLFPKGSLLSLSSSSRFSPPQESPFGHPWGDLRLTLAILVSFQPMMVFANVGVNSDALGNLLFTLFLFFSARLLIKRVTLLTIISLLLVVILSIYTKPQFIIMVPLIFILVIFLVLRERSYQKKQPAVLLTFLLFSLIMFLLFKFKIGPISLLSRFYTNLDVASLVKFTYEYTVPRTYKEVLPWYWGIYDWLGVTYPRIVHRIISRIMIVAGLGFLWLVYQIIRKKQFGKRMQAVVFLAFTSVLFYIGVSFYDWWLWYTSKYPLGVQGRYFFPVITVHMLLILLGWQALFPYKIKKHAVKLLGILMIILNLFALYTVANVYYDLSSFSVFIAQVSQYKPQFIKGGYFVFLIFIYIVTIFYFLVSYIFKDEKS